MINNLPFIYLSKNTVSIPICHVNAAQDEFSVKTVSIADRITLTVIHTGIGNSNINLECH